MIAAGTAMRQAIKLNALQGGRGQNQLPGAGHLIGDDISSELGMLTVRANRLDASGRPSKEIKISP
jgi:hypothetical protein